jgi:hypothetical protein
VPLRVRRSTRSPGMECTPSKMPASGPPLPKQLQRQVLAVREPVGGKRGGRTGGCSSIGYHCARGAGSDGRRGGFRGGRLVKALLKVPRKLLQPTQIDHRVSVVLPDDGERLTFCGVDGVRCWRSGHRLAVRVDMQNIARVRAPCQRQTRP